MCRAACMLLRLTKWAIRIGIFVDGPLCLTYENDGEVILAFFERTCDGGYMSRLKLWPCSTCSANLGSSDNPGT
jgi:hypothetical protein